MKQDKPKKASKILVSPEQKEKQSKVKKRVPKSFEEKIKRTLDFNPNEKKKDK